MIGRLNHVAIAVPNLGNAIDVYRNMLGAKVSEPVKLVDHGVITVFVELDNTSIELLHPLDDSSPIKKFLVRNPAGGVHHVCYEVKNIILARDELRSSGARVIGSGKPEIGAHGQPVLFLHPKDFFGTLIELQQTP